MLGLLVWVVIAVIVFAFLWWVVSNYLPEPMRRFAILVIALVGVIFIVWLLLSVVGGGLPVWGPPPHAIHRF